jgi:hypothetical protein
MTHIEAQNLHAAACAADARGDVAEALTVYRTLLERHPLSPEAADAVYYMTSGHRRPAAHTANPGEAAS